jgi:predicted NACHT family NTPase
MEKVEEFLASDQRVFLLLGDSGAGKSTFNRELEYNLWQSYKKNDPIPLHINLPAIDKPEHDMIAKQLRKCEFTEPQIRELKLHRRFVLICDGYDESQQTRNLYTNNRLNQTGEWNAKMLISCRSEYLGADYRDRFQPGDRNHQSEQESFQEAVITPFSMNQVQEYIAQYVSIHRPLWEANGYKRALKRIPSLKELVKNPFLMSLSLEVLPRMVDPGHELTSVEWHCMINLSSTGWSEARSDSEKRT